MPSGCCEIQGTRPWQHCVLTASPPKAGQQLELAHGQSREGRKGRMASVTVRKINKVEWRDRSYQYKGTGMMERIQIRQKSRSREELKTGEKICDRSTGNGKRGKRAVRRAQEKK